ncbi:hypothetical protein CNMCM8980_000892 [Aspergillus fumigatiaffinis]|nr:hypothetical protein CNMCM8980_000892 [Aspergillus fumigatiaffinis]
MSNETIESGHQPGSIPNSSVRTSCDEVNFTVRYCESELQSIARESSPLNVMLRELKEYSSVLRQGGSVALHRGETLMSPKLSKQVEKLFTHKPKVDGPPKSWTDIVLWAGPVPRRVCSAAQLTVGDTQIELHKDDHELLCSGRPWAFLSPWPYPGDIEKELQVVEETLADVQKIKEMVNKGLWAPRSYLSYGAERDTAN